MKEWKVFQVENEEEAIMKINDLEKEGYKKEEISILAKQKEKKLAQISKKMDVNIEKPVNKTAFGIISGILQSLSGGLVIPQVYTPDYGALYAAGPFAKWFSTTDKKQLRQLLKDFDLDEEQIRTYLNGLEMGKILVFAR